jgi:protein ImuB
VWLRRLSTDRLIRSRSPAPADRATPLVVVEPVTGALRLSAVNDAAAQLGLRTGLALADARAMYPRIAVADADPAADRQLLEAIADWCDRYTPLIGLDPSDGLVLDIAGCAHLFGGEAALGRDILRRLAAQGFHARAAVADTVGCAWATARYASSLPQRGREMVVPSGMTRAALLPLPLAALRLDADTVAALAQVGLKRIADVIDRPRAPLAARFGENFVRRLDQALGGETESISPRRPVPSYVAERRFPEPIMLADAVLGTIAQLAQELSRLMERRGVGARRLEAALFRTDGKVFRIAAGTGAPLRESGKIRALFVERLAAVGDDCDPGFGFDVVRLAALATERCAPEQTGLAAPDHGSELAHLIDRLGARFGLRRVTRLVPQDTHIPEFAVTAMPAAAALQRVIPAERVAREPGPMVPHVRKIGSQLGSPRSPAGMTTEKFAQDSLSPVRPIRLFERPERIEATAQVPDGPPVQFTWRHVNYKVVHAEGPERIAMDWWRDEQGRQLTRDYFRIESREGLRVWLYREGFYDKDAPPSWFLHGVFA